MKNLKEIPNFKSPEEEAQFWNTHDSAGYLDWSKAKKTVFPNLKSSTESIPRCGCHLHYWRASKVMIA